MDRRNDENRTYSLGQTDGQTQTDSADFITFGDIAFGVILLPLRKHACSNILKILPPKNENFQMTNSDIFRISAQSIDCGYSFEPPRRGGSNEYPQSMFLSRNKKNISL